MHLVSAAKRARKREKLSIGRSGTNRAQMLDGLHNDGRLDKVDLLVGGAMKDNCEHNRGYGYL